VVGSCECGNEPSRSIKCREFLDQLRPVSFSGRTMPHGMSSLRLLSSKPRNLSLTRVITTNMCMNINGFMTGGEYREVHWRGKHSGLREAWIGLIHGASSHGLSIICSYFCCWNTVCALLLIGR
jgi:hypothetical protein